MSIAIKHTMKEAGYKHIKSLGHGIHILQDIETGQLEKWFANKHHASYGIKYKNTHLEFCCSL